MGKTYTENLFVHYFLFQLFSFTKTISITNAGDFITPTTALLCARLSSVK